MKRYYEVAFFLIAFTIGLYVGDFVTDNNGQSSIANEMFMAVLLLIACFVFDVFSQWHSKNK